MVFLLAGAIIVAATGGQFQLKAECEKNLLEGQRCVMKYTPEVVSE